MDLGLLKNITRPGISQSAPQGPDFRKEFCPLEELIYKEFIWIQITSVFS